MVWWREVGSAHRATADQPGARAVKCKSYVLAVRIEVIDSCQSLVERDRFRMCCEELRVLMAFI